MTPFSKTSSQFYRTCLFLMGTISYDVSSKSSEIGKYIKAEKHGR